MKPNPRRFDFAVYPYHVQMDTRFADVDPLWHVNNVKISEYYQEARIAFQGSLYGQIDFERSSGSRTLVVHQSIDYLHEVKWPGAVTLGVGVGHVGNSSFSLMSAMFQQERCVGLGTSVLVHASAEGSAPLPAPWREALEKRLLPQDAR
jgi:acyl-CoA thioester hydrolase